MSFSTWPCMLIRTHGHLCRCDSKVSTLAVRILPLHHRWDLIEECAELLNSHWHRSVGARMHSLHQSSDSYPVCLVMLEGELLIGHARLSRVLGSRSAFVESVVVRGELRGRGYGRALMEGVESYARSHGFTRLYLTTHDKQHFYAHLSFILSRPVQNVGTLATLLPMELLHKLCRSPKNEGDEKTKMKEAVPAPNNVLSPLSLPPPPLPGPPPPPPNIPPVSNSAFLNPSSSLFHPPLPPPLPTPLSSCSSIASPAQSLSPSAASLVEQTLEQTPYTDCRGLPVFWMHKDI